MLGKTTCLRCSVASINNSTGKSPENLIFSFVPRFPLDVPFSHQEYADADKIRMKVRYDHKRIAVLQFRVNDLVQIERRILKKGITSRKLVDKYAGPYKVMKVYPNDRYMVSRLIRADVNIVIS